MITNVLDQNILFEKKNSKISLKNKPVDPAFFGYYAFPTKKKARLVFLFKTKKPFLENGLESPLIFVFILKGKTK